MQSSRVFKSDNVASKWKRILPAVTDFFLPFLGGFLLPTPVSRSGNSSSVKLKELQRSAIQDTVEENVTNPFSE